MKNINKIYILSCLAYLIIMTASLAFVSCSINNNPVYPNTHVLTLISSENKGCVSPDELENSPYEAKVSFKYVSDTLRLEVIFKSPGPDAFQSKFQSAAENVTLYYDETKKLEKDNICLVKMVYYMKVKGYDYLIISVNQRHLEDANFYTPLVSLIALRTFTWGD